MLHQFNSSDDSFETFEHLTKDKKIQAQKQITVLTFYEFYVQILTCKITTAPAKKQNQKKKPQSWCQHDSYWAGHIRSGL